MHFRFQNVNEAFNRLLLGFQAGEYLDENLTLHKVPVARRPSRNGDVLLIEEPCTITYLNPRQRVLFNQARDCNPVFHMFEALWMLAGRNDIKPLRTYISNYDFSDDGVTQNGAYGYRWRQSPPITKVRPPCPDCGKDWGHGYCGTCGGKTYLAERHQKVDQLKILADHLKDDPNSRRAVLQMWNVEDDLLKLGVDGSKPSKDVCCLAPETKFRSPEGDLTIEELSKKFQSDASFKFPVYAVDTVTGDQRLTWMTNAWKTGTKVIYKIGFDDGSFLRMTSNHTVFKKTKMFEGKRCTGVKVEECLVADLQIGDRLLAAFSEDCSSRLSPGGYRQFKRNIFRNTAGNNMVLEHREYVSMFEELKSYRDDGFSIHHKNSDKLDNRIDNLQQMSNSDHFPIGKFGEDNPHCKMSEEDRAARGRNHSISIRNHLASLTPELRSALVTRKKNRTPEQLALIADYHSSKSNHKIVSIERDGYGPVYDFTVPGRHNAVLSNGVVVHNCNLSVMFSIRSVHEEVDTGGFDPQGHPINDGVTTKLLDMTVTNRSNDLVWGMLGANVVHFSFLQEYMAARLGCEVGVYNQFTNNLHVYCTRKDYKPDAWLSDETPDAYVEQPINYVPLVQNADRFDQEVARFIDVDWNDANPRAPGWHGFLEPFLETVASPMCRAFVMHKNRDYSAAIYWCNEIKADDWRIACYNWIEKRRIGWETKNAEV